MPIPDISHLQFAVLRLLLDHGETLGVDLREELSKLGAEHTRAAFYQLMRRLEDAGLVEGSYRQSVVDEVAIKERVYVISKAGSAAANQAQMFYATSTTPQFKLT